MSQYTAHIDPEWQTTDEEPKTRELSQGWHEQRRQPSKMLILIDNSCELFFPLERSGKQATNARVFFFSKIS